MESTKEGQILLGCLMLCPAECWTSPRMEITLLLWLLFNFWIVLWLKTFYLNPDWNFPCHSLCFASHSVTMRLWEEMLSTATEHQWFPWLKFHVWAQCSKCSLNREEFCWLDMFFLKQLSMTVFAAEPCRDLGSTFCPPSLWGNFLQCGSSACAAASRCRSLYLSNFMRFL